MKIKYTKEQIQKAINKIFDSNGNKKDSIDLSDFIVQLFLNLDLSTEDKKMYELFDSVKKVSETIDNLSPEGLKNIANDPSNFSKMENMFKNLFKNMNINPFMDTSSNEENEEENAESDETKIN